MIKRWGLCALLMLGLLVQNVLADALQVVEAQLVTAIAPFTLPQAAVVPVPEQTKRLVIAPTIAAADADSEKMLGAAWLDQYGLRLHLALIGFDQRLAVLPPSLRDLDAYSLTSESVGEAMQRAAKRVGYPYVLQTTVALEKGMLVTQLRLLRSSGELLAQARLVHPQNKVDQQLGAVAAFIVDQLGIVVDPHTLAQRTTFSEQAWQQAERNLMCLANACRHFNLHADWLVEPADPLLAWMVAYYAVDSNAIQYQHSLQLLEHPFSLVRWQAAWSNIQTAPRQLSPQARAVFLQLAQDNPGDPSMLIALANSYSTEVYTSASGPNENGPTMVVSPPSPHFPSYAFALAQSLLNVAAWPENYRAWWELEYALGRYANTLRGGLRWMAMTEQARSRFSAVTSVREMALKEALARNADQVTLWLEKMEVDRLKGSGIYTAFEQAVRLAPHYAKVYYTAYALAQPQWGGDAALRRHIYQTALKHNPQDSWVQEQYQAFAPEAQGWWARVKMWFD